MHPGQHHGLGNLRMFGRECLNQIMCFHDGELWCLFLHRGSHHGNVCHVRPQGAGLTEVVVEVGEDDRSKFVERPGEVGFHTILPILVDGLGQRGEMTVSNVFEKPCDGGLVVASGDGRHIVGVDPLLYRGANQAQRGGRWEVLQLIVVPIPKGFQGTDGSILNLPENGMFPGLIELLEHGEDLLVGAFVGCAGGSADSTDSPVSFVDDVGATLVEPEHRSTLRVIRCMITVG